MPATERTLKEEREMKWDRELNDSKINRVCKV